MNIISQKTANRRFWNTSVTCYENNEKVEVFIVKDFEVKQKGVGGGIRGSQIDESTIELYKKQSSSRAGTRIRRLVLANELKYMWTLTYADEITDIEQVLADFNNFKRNLKLRDNKKLNYVAVVEVQEERSKKAGKEILHLHFATDRRINIKLVNDSWKKGYVFVSEFSGDIYKVASYLGKYIKKGIDSTAVIKDNKKRYLTSIGLKKPLRIDLITSEKHFIGMVKNADYVKEFEQGIWLLLNKRRLSPEIAHEIEKQSDRQNKKVI